MLSEAQEVLDHGTRLNHCTWKLGRRVLSVHRRILPGWRWGRVWEYRQPGQRPQVVKVEEL